MKGLCIFFFATILGCHFTLGAEILRGYMASKDGSACIKNGVDVISTSAVPATAVGLSGASCTLLSVKDAVSAGQYIIEEQADPTKQVKLSDALVITFGNPGTPLVFITEETTAALTGISSADVRPLTTLSAAVYVASATDDTDNTDCLLVTGYYNQGNDASACTNQLWYFVPEDCIGSNCMSCNPDPALCSECAADAAVNNAGDACVACNAVADCLACTLDPNDNIVCDSCDNSKVPSASGDNCFTCTVDNCETCSADNVCDACVETAKVPSSNGSACVSCTVENCRTCSANDACDSCFGPLFPNAAGDACDECSNLITDCHTCSYCNGVTICTDCDNCKEPSSNGSACVTCTVAECDTCSTDDVCDACTDARKEPSSDGSACVTCTVSGCDTCSADNVCDACAETTKEPSSDGSACVNCTDTDCDTCSADDVCDACTDGSKEPSSDGSACITCTVGNCDTCSADGVCDSCLSPLFPNAAGDACDVCSNLITDCHTCTLKNRVTICTACDNYKGPLSDGSACVTCVVPGCEMCSADDVCDVCSDATKEPSSDGSACVTTSTARQNKAALHIICLLTVAVLNFVLFIFI